MKAGTRQYIDVNNATAAGYGSFLGCVAGTDHGAMGIHYVNGTLLANLTLDPSQPQALIYEPDNGKMTLVGVEFILDSASWLAASSDASGARRTGLQFRPGPQSLQHQFVLRAPRLGVAR